MEIKTLEDAKRALADIANIRREITDTENILNQQVDDLKRQAGEIVLPLQDRLKATEKALELYAGYNRSTLFPAGSKSIDLGFGTLFFRASRSLRLVSRAWTWEKVLEKLRETEARDAIRVRESVNKDVLKCWKPDRLRDVGVKLSEQDKFGYELNTERLGR